jgi:Transcriptional regulator, AbiEi antitoxin
MRTLIHTAARIASRQNGVVTRQQLLDAGVTASGIKRLVANGTLIPVHRGVYRVGHTAPSLLATYTAAVLACGDGAVLSGRAAANVQRLARRGNPPPPEVRTRLDRRPEGVVISRGRRLDRRDVTRMHDVPITTVPRTIVDLAGLGDADELARAVHQAQVLHGVRPHHVETVLARRPNARGAGTLREILRGGALLGELERRFRQVLKEERVPLPVVNRKKDGHYVDCRWAKERLTVELTSFRYHNSRQSWEDDRQRQREARARGDRFREYTWHDVVEDSAAMRAELRRLLGR